jgi:uncharacterized protein (TIGR02186 family)
MILRALALWCALLLPAAAQEAVVSGLSQNRVGITANFDGSEIVVFAAVARTAPAPPGRLDVIVTVEGPVGPVIVRRKARVFGIWVNTEAVEVDAAPAFYAIAATGPLSRILSETENLRHRIRINEAVRAVGTADQAEDSPAFVEALIRLRRETGLYQVRDGGVLLDRDTLIRSDIRLPASLSEGRFRVRVFLLRDGAVVGQEETEITVQKEGIERFLHRLALDEPLIYGILSLSLAILAGWLASTAFAWVRR